MNLRFLIFISVLMAVLALGNYYLGRKVIAYVDFFSRNQWIVWTGCAVFIALQFLGPILYRGFPGSGFPGGPGVAVFIQWVIYTALGFFACWFLYSAIGEFGVWIARRIVSTPIDPDRRVFFGALAAAVGSGVVGVAQAMLGPNVYRVSVPIKNLPAGLKGLRIAQISDLHIGPILGHDYAKKVVDITNSLQPDVIALTGDFVDGTVAHIADRLSVLSQLRAKHGVFYVTGNHEYYWDAAEWSAVFQKLGAVVLKNEHRVIEHGGEKLVIGGVTDLSAGQFHPEEKSDPVKFGLTSNIKTYHPVKMVFHEWQTIFNDLKKKCTPGQKFMYVFGPPGWSHDGSSKTSNQLRKELKQNN